MRKLISIMSLLAAFLIGSGKAEAQRSKSKPKAKTDPSLTISNKKTKKVKDKMMKRKGKTTRPQLTSMLVYRGREVRRGEWVE